MSTPLLPLSPGLYRTRNGRIAQVIGNDDDYLGNRWFGCLRNFKRVRSAKWFPNGTIYNVPEHAWDLVERIEEPKPRD